MAEISIGRRGHAYLSLDACRRSVSFACCFAVAVCLSIATLPSPAFAQGPTTIDGESLADALAHAEELIHSESDGGLSEAYIGLPSGYRFFDTSGGEPVLNLPPADPVEADLAGVVWQPFSSSDEGDTDYVCMVMSGAEDGTDNDTDFAIDEPDEIVYASFFLASRVVRGGKVLGYRAVQTVRVHSHLTRNLNTWSNAATVNTAVLGNFRLHGAAHIFGIENLAVLTLLDFNGTIGIFNNYGVVGGVGGISADLAARIGYTGDPDTSHPKFAFVDADSDGVEDDFTLEAMVRIKSGNIDLVGFSTIGEESGPEQTKHSIDRFHLGDGGGDEIISGAERIFSDNGHDNAYDLGNAAEFPTFESEYGNVFITEKYLFGFDATSWVSQEGVIYPNLYVGTERVFLGDIQLSAGGHHKSAFANSFYWNASVADASAMPDTGVVGEAPGTGHMPSKDALSEKIIAEENFIWYDSSTSEIVVSGRVPVDGHVVFESGSSSGTFHYEGKGSIAALDMDAGGDGGDVYIDADLLTTGFPDQNLLGLMAQHDLSLALSSPVSVMGGVYAQNSVLTDHAPVIVGAVAADSISAYGPPEIFWVPGLPSSWTAQMRMIHGPRMRMIGAFPRELKADRDDDGMPDWWEEANGLDPDIDDASDDPDTDGLPNDEEYLAGTDPNHQDSDEDGLVDGYEVYIVGTDPLNADSDDDGLGDGQEVGLGTNPNAEDSDEDGLADGEEVALGTNPLNEDTDGDGALDGEELDGGSDPLDEAAFPTDRVWVDSAYDGEPVGTRLKPVTSLEAAEIVVLDGGMVLAAPGDYPFDSTLGTLGKAYSIYTLGGPVTVGPVE